MALKAVLFDLDDTLIVDEAVSREAFANVARDAFAAHGVNETTFASDAAAIAREKWKDGPANSYCRNVGISAYECLWGNFEGDHPELTKLREWSEGFRHEVFDAALRRQQIEDAAAAADLARKFMSHRRKLARLMPNANEVVATLALKYKLGLVTNGAPRFQREKFENSGLHHGFHATIVSGDIALGKPNKEIFERILKELNCAPEEAVMVGNSLERDIQGARNAGIRSVWIQIAGSEEHADVEPHHTIRDLIELPPLLEKI